MAKKVLNLTVLERMLLTKLLPENGSLVTMGISEEILDMIAISSEELDDMDITENQIITKELADKIGTKAFEIASTSMLDLLKKQAQECDTAGRVTLANLSLIRKINAL